MGSSLMVLDVDGLGVVRHITTGDFICNPTYEEQANSDLDLIIAGTTEYISMIEAGAKEISEEDMLTVRPS